MRLKAVNQQVVVIVGASSGIGRAAALAFAAQGAKVVVAARSRKGLESLVDEIQKRGGVAVAVVADAADPAEMKHVADRAVAELGCIDTWVHAAAVAVWARFEETPPDAWQRLVEVNLLGQVHGALAALPHLRSAGGAFIQVSSVEAKVALPFSSAYAATKAGASAFLDALRLELRRDRVPVAVTQILPASIDTPLYQNGLTRLGVQARPPPPLNDPDLVARAIVHAAEHPTRDLVVGGAGLLLLWLARLSPRLVDAILLGRIGFEAQLTSKPRSDTAPNNLFAPTADANLKVRGDLGAEALASSPATALQESALARLGARVSGAVYGVVGRAVNAIYALRFRGSLGEVPAPHEPAEPPSEPTAPPESPRPPDVRMASKRKAKRET